MRRKVPAWKRARRVSLHETRGTCVKESQKVKHMFIRWLVVARKCENKFNWHCHVLRSLLLTVAISTVVAECWAVVVPIATVSCFLLSLFVAVCRRRYCCRRCCRYRALRVPLSPVAFSRVVACRASRCCCRVAVTPGAALSVFAMLATGSPHRAGSSHTP